MEHGEWICTHTRFSSKVLLNASFYASHSRVRLFFFLFFFLVCLCSRFPCYYYFLFSNSCRFRFSRSLTLFCFGFSFCHILSANLQLYFHLHTIYSFVRHYRMAFALFVVFVCLFSWFSIIFISTMFSSLLAHTCNFVVVVVAAVVRHIHNSDSWFCWKILEIPGFRNYFLKNAMKSGVLNSFLTFLSNISWFVCIMRLLKNHYNTNTETHAYNNILS